MRSTAAAVVVLASLIAAGCQQPPSATPSTPGLRNDLVPLGTGGEMAPPAAAAPLVTPAATTVNCGPNRQAVVRQVQLDGKPTQQVDCVAAGTAAATPPAATRTVTSQRPVRSEVQREPKRSWKKSAVVIGGSSAAGAGIGALIGGKKGALIGAAAGGGAGTVYEVKKKKKKKSKR